VQGFAPDQLNISWNGKDQLAELTNQGLFSLPIPPLSPLRRLMIQIEPSTTGRVHIWR
jgi:hypothetical protein